MKRLRPMGDDHFERAIESALAGIVIVCALIMMPSVAMANNAAMAELDDFQRADDETLDIMRGGFLTAGNLQINFSIERAVVMDGEFVSRAMIDVSQLNEASGQAAAIPPSLPDGIMMVVQNAVDFKVITNLNIINVEVSNLRSIAADAFGAMLSDQIANSAR
ncbi:MAG: hypothetical protein IDH49_02910 [Gammaproteobacteria bacterium]|nr:hypothetical protein [Gammaproteobacteria bacterium]